MKKIKSASVLIITLIVFLGILTVSASATMNLGGEISIELSSGDTLTWNVDRRNASYLLEFYRGDTIKMTIQGKQTTGNLTYIKSKLEAINPDSGVATTICSSGTYGLGVDSSGPKVIFALNSDLSQLGFIGRVPSEFGLNDLGNALENTGDWDDHSVVSGVLNLTNSLGRSLLLELDAEGFISSVTAFYKNIEVFSASFESYTPFVENSVPSYELSIIISVLSLVTMISVIKYKIFKTKRKTDDF
ncbi:MAG: hypothetical protein JW891_00520 [Candidatus Lokiarchaeota archaeon]|nr:hypothetical protein [Candidatus Lokiarchaeota archaeon]